MPYKSFGKGNGFSLCRISPLGKGTAEPVPSLSEVEGERAVPYKSFGKGNGFSLCRISPLGKGTAEPVPCEGAVPLEAARILGFSP